MKETLKSKRSRPEYCGPVLRHGNAKLKDEINAKYVQFNLPAIITCPFRSKDCEKFCYAKRDERWPAVRENRAAALERSRRESFVADMIFTLETEMQSRRYAGKLMLVRLHESGDFYSFEYFRKWIEIAAHFTGRGDAINIHFYTKCFAFLLALDENERATVNELLRQNVLTINLSFDNSTAPVQVERAFEIFKLFPLVNSYTAAYTTDGNFDHVCDCSKCAECRHCSKATGSKTVVKIH